MVSWHGYDGDEESTVVGDLRVSDPVEATHLDIDRELLAYLPPSYESSDREYPVVYMHDGQNLFDEATSYDGEWQVDETMETLASEGIEAIVVGIPNAGDKRTIEYAPYYDPTNVPAEVDLPQDVEPLGDAYTDWLNETIRPAVESTFRTNGERGLFGSSMGGLISLYAFFRDPDVFTFAGAMSPAVSGPFEEIQEYVETTGHVDGRLYVDVGGAEFEDDPHQSAQFEQGVTQLVETLDGMGYTDELRYVYDADAEHHESEWARRFPEAMRFLLG